MQASINESDSLEQNLFQQDYISQQLLENPDRKDKLEKLVSMFWPMKNDCRLSVCIPAYRESWIISNTLRHYTLNQLWNDWNVLEPKLFEINILINKPNQDTPDDIDMLKEIEDFKSAYPEYNINIANIVYDFWKKPIIWLIFKDIADSVIIRNLSRSEVSDKDKSNLILRTAWADVESLNPFLLSRTISIFSDSNVVAHRGETRLPPEILKSFPLLHVMQTLAVFLLRQYHGNQTTNGPFSYSAEAYSRVWWFNPEKSLWEEIDLAKRIWKLTQDIECQLIFIKDLVKDVINNPRRQIHSLLNWSWMAWRYQNFWQTLNEDSLRMISNWWKNIKTSDLPDFCLLNPENLSREVSAYYRVYVKIANSNNTPIEEIDIIFMKAFRMSGITEYSFNKSQDNSENHIEIKNIDWLLKQMKEQNFSWWNNFSK